MKYVIYEIVCPNFLKETKPDGYYIKTIDRCVLEEIDIFDVESRHDSFELALAEIKSKAEKLKHLKLTIMTVISVSWNGEIN